MNQNCPVCGTRFNIGPRDEGKQFVCFKCSTTLTVARDGIQAAGAPPPSPLPPLSPLPLGAEPLEAPAPSRPGLAWLRRVDTPTWLFAVGTFFVILFLFLPLIKQAKTRRVKGALDLGAAREKNKDEDFKKIKSPSPQDITRRESERSDWAKESSRLELEHSSASAEAAMADYWYTWGMMFSFMLLAGASLGYLDPAQPTIRRVIGATVLLAEVLLIFLRYVMTAR